MSQSIKIQLLDYKKLTFSVLCNIIYIRKSNPQPFRLGAKIPTGGIPTIKKEKAYLSCEVKKKINLNHRRCLNVSRKSAFF